MHSTLICVYSVYYNTGDPGIIVDEDRYEKQAYSAEDTRHYRPLSNDTTQGSSPHENTQVYGYNYYI